MNEEAMQMMGQVNGGGDRRVQEDLRVFREVFPEAARDPRAIPAEVWEEVRNGRSLAAAYGRYLEEQARGSEDREVQERAARQNAENQFRALGSMHTGERGFGEYDAFLRGFQE